MDPETTTAIPVATDQPHDYGHPEINAMARIIEALNAIDEEAHARVLQWACARAGVSAP